MAHYGKVSGDVSIQMDSMRWYSRGLEGQRLENTETQRQLEEGNSVDGVYNETVICTPIMFILFETVMGTTTSAWAQHLKAASIMLEMIGPWKCQRGILHHIFKSVRIGAVRLPFCATCYSR